MKAFRDEVVERLARASGLAPEAVDRALDVPDAERGDFAMPCFALAKERKAPPPKIAAEIAAKVETGGRVAKAVAAGPYVNVFVDRARLASETLEEIAKAGLRFGCGHEGEGKTAVIDFSAPNVAKPLAFHHLRSTMIGNSLARLYQARGWAVVGVNHLGDWGTAFGKLLAAFELWGDEPLRGDDPRALSAFYVKINAEIKSRPELEDSARAWFKRLEDGDETARARWRRCVEISMIEFEAVYQRLGVTFDHVTGESFYEDKMPAVIAELREKGLLEESEGAQIVRVELPGDTKEIPPALIVKRDGATLYLTRDLAAAEYRRKTFAFDRALYVIGAEQSMHFVQLKRVLARAGHAWESGIRHIPFGLVLMGGSKAATRAGNVVLLMDVLDEAVAKVDGVIRDKNPDGILRLRGSALADQPRSSADDRSGVQDDIGTSSTPSRNLENASRPDAAGVAKAVGVGAVVFNDLKNRRQNDVEFDLDAILSFEGKTGPYVQYSHARACAILRRHGAALPPLASDAGARLSDPTEHAIVRVLARFPERVARAVEMDEPSEVATHLLDLCEAFHAYHTKGGRDPALRVLGEDVPLRAARLHLVDAVRRTLANGLTLLGISAPNSM